ncbi:MAG: glutamate-cysteine ligase family protein [Schaalia turicensis]
MPYFQSACVPAFSHPQADFRGRHSGSPRLPTAGLPHLLDSWEQVEDLEERLKRAGGIVNFNEVRWDVRPSPGCGTIEVRSFDSATNMTELRALSALVHALVETVSRDLDRGVAPAVLPRELLELNKWRASRFGPTDSRCV